jgi:hypothetical protein
MIALPSQLPLLQIGDHHLQEYDGRWLAENIREAADAQGQADWWIADDIARGVISYLRHRYAQTTITLEALTSKIREALNRIGFKEVAEALNIATPVVTLDVLELVRESERLELTFFPLLEERLSHLQQNGAQRIVLGSLREAAKALSSSKHWCEAAENSRREILATARSQILPKSSLFVLDRESDELTPQGLGNQMA